MALAGTSGLIWSVAHRPCRVCDLAGIYALKLLTIRRLSQEETHPGGRVGGQRGWPCGPSGPVLAPDRGEDPVSLLHLGNGASYAECSPGLGLGAAGVVVLTNSPRMRGRELSECVNE